jgi:hypothetical protein
MAYWRMQNNQIAVGTLVHMYKGKQLILNPTYQRDLAWTLIMRKRLIDTMLRDMAVPALFFHRKMSGKREIWETLDGQQRLATIFAYLNDEFALVQNAEPVDEIDIRKKSYSQLPEELQARILGYTFNACIVDTNSESMITEQFQRLNSGRPLTSQNRRDAIPCELNVQIRQLAKVAAFDYIEFGNGIRGGVERQWIARLFLYTYHQRIVNANTDAIDRLYAGSASGAITDGEIRAVAETVARNLNTLAAIFHKHPYKYPSSVCIPLYLMFTRVLAAGLKTKPIAPWLHDFYVAYIADDIATWSTNIGKIGMATDRVELMVQDYMSYLEKKA